MPPPIGWVTRIEGVSICKVLKTMPGCPYHPHLHPCLHLHRALLLRIPIWNQPFKGASLWGRGLSSAEGAHSLVVGLGGESPSVWSSPAAIPAYLLPENPTPLLPASSSDPTHICLRQDCVLHPRAGPTELLPLIPPSLLAIPGDFGVLALVTARSGAPWIT